ncbi:MAG: delta-lactam-biosynthetic de-N-acetylase [Massiliimalia sp.]
MMKKRKILALVLAMSLTVCTCFTSCNNEDKDKNTSSGSVVSDVVSDGKEVVSGIESEGEKIISGTESNMESMFSNDSSEESNRDASLDASSYAAANAPTDISKLDFSSLSSLSNEKHGWGQGKETDEKNRPVSCLQFQEKYGNLNADFIGSEKKEILLTFDEGYENGYTEKILDVLKEEKCPAVFFVTMPYVKENPDLIQRMIDEGHTVGNHTVNHPSMPQISLEEAAQEITELHQYIKENFDYEMTLFRPPMGEWSEQTLALTQKLGYRSVFWSFAYQDWLTDQQPDPDEALQKVNESLHPGAIYLLHAVSSTNTAILSDFIEFARSEGYVFQSI